jgi:lysophospholipase L1-like esterase
VDRDAQGAGGRVVLKLPSHVGALSPRMKLLFWTITLSLPAFCFVGVWAFWHRRHFDLPSGKELNQAAWEASFRERGLAVPRGGPRDGYWGNRMPRRKGLKDPEAEVHWPGLVEEDAAGMQRYALPSARVHILVIGGSVAWGAYASGEDETYFAQAAKRLAEAGWPVRFTVLAAGAWTSDNELSALRGYGLGLRPDVVVFLDGLNDLMGKGHSDEVRVRRYLDNLHQARDLAEAGKAMVVIALQPTLAVKRNRSPLEDRILELTERAQTIPAAYARMRAELRGLEDEAGTRFVDCSDALSEERATTFADIWHFADPGHRSLARCLADGLLPVLVARDRPHG